jgi:hypothetical protein
VTVPLFTVRVEATPELPDDMTQELHRLIGVGVRAAVDALAQRLPPQVRWSHLVLRGAAFEPPLEPSPAPDPTPHPFVDAQPRGVTCLLLVGRDRVCGRTRADHIHTTTGGEA